MCPSYRKTNRIVVAVDSWPRYSRYPHGHFVRILGKLGDKVGCIAYSDTDGELKGRGPLNRFPLFLQATENEVLLLEHDIPHSSFSQSVLDCLPAMPWGITAADEERRVDCRHLDICSVDPPGCTDIDDALHCRQDGFP